jgi:hypothetical protein
MARGHHGHAHRYCAHRAGAAFVKIGRVIKVADADINFIAHQFERIISDVAALRDDMAVLTAIAEDDAPRDGSS